MNGERDLGRLRDGALLALTQSNLRSGRSTRDERFKRLHKFIFEYSEFVRRPKASETC